MVRLKCAGALLVVISLVACGGSGGSTGGGGVAPTAPTATPANTAAAAPASMPQSGTAGTSSVFVGSNGHTLYVLSSDPANTSSCSGSCAGIWPPYAAPAGTVAPAGSGFGIITRSDSTLQWTFGTAPLYEYSGDTAAGTASGQGITSFGGTWTAAQPATVTPGPSATPYNPYIIHR